jgi:SagB-type dehydrogenase family enzyme
MSEGIGDRFQRETSYHRNRMPRGGLDWDNKPEIYKTYPGRKRIALPKPKGMDLSLDVILKSRKSIRHFSKEPLSMEHVSYLLWATTGIQRVEQGYEFRTVPSAGALYPIETYILANNVSGFEPGIYHYAIQDHQLESLNVGEFGTRMARGALDQAMVRDGQAVFVWTAVLERSKWKYKQRAYRYIYLDCGHMGQNLALAAVGLGLGSCQIGALFDDEVNSLLGVDGKEETVVYMSVVGHPR